MSGPWGDAPITLDAEQEQTCRNAWMLHGSGGYCEECGMQRCRESTIAAAVLIQAGYELGGQPNSQVTA